MITTDDAIEILNGIRLKILRGTEYVAVKKTVVAAKASVHYHDECEIAFSYCRQDGIRIYITLDTNMEMSVIYFEHDTIKDIENDTPRPEREVILVNLIEPDSIQRIISEVYSLLTMDCIHARIP